MILLILISSIYQLNTSMANTNGNMIPTNNLSYYLSILTDIEKIESKIIAYDVRIKGFKQFLNYTVNNFT